MSYILSQLSLLLSDVFKNVYTISSDTKIVSKVLEIHLFPKILEFANRHGYKMVLAEHQNYYPDISFVKSGDKNVKFAVDFKTTYQPFQMGKEVRKRSPH